MSAGLRAVTAGLLLCAMTAQAEETMTDRVGDFRIGDRLDVDALGPGWDVSDGGDATDCALLSGGSLPADIGLMVLDGRVARFEIRGEAMADGAAPSFAPFGLRVGMSLRDAAVRFPDEPLDIDFHKYAWPPGIYLSWFDAAGNRAVRVEVPDAAVDVILWGTPEAVRLTEGCV